MSNKTYLEFDGFDEVIARLNKLNANTKNKTIKIKINFTTFIIITSIQTY